MNTVLETKERLEFAPAEVRQFGVIPWRFNRAGKVEVLLLSDRHGGRLTFPMGALARGRAQFMSAALVAFDEAGVVGDIYPHPVADFSSTEELPDGTIGPCRVTLFGIHVRGTLVNWPGSSHRTRRWLPLEDADHAVDSPQYAEVLRTMASDPDLLTLSADNERLVAEPRG